MSTSSGLMAAVGVTGDGFFSSLSYLSGLSASTVGGGLAGDFFALFDAEGPAAAVAAAVLVLLSGLVDSLSATDSANDFFLAFLSDSGEIFLTASNSNGSGSLNSYTSHSSLATPAAAEPVDATFGDMDDSAAATTTPDFFGVVVIVAASSTIGLLDVSEPATDRSRLVAFSAAMAAAAAAAAALLRSAKWLLSPKLRPTTRDLFGDFDSDTGSAGVIFEAAPSSLTVVRSAVAVVVIVVDVAAGAFAVGTFVVGNFAAGVFVLSASVCLEFLSVPTSFDGATTFSVGRSIAATVDAGAFLNTSVCSLPDWYFSCSRSVRLSSVVVLSENCESSSPNESDASLSPESDDTVGLAVR